MTDGIYGYFDIENEEIVYIGKDTHIDKDRRHKDHLKPCRYDKQPFNRILQNNQNRYVYKRIYECPPYLDGVDLNGLEMQYIEAINPRFNLTKGGDGALGFKHSDETKRKLSQINKGENHPHYGKPLSAETRKKIGEVHKDKVIPKEMRKSISKKLSEKYNTTGYYRVHIQHDKRYTQGFRWVYEYRIENKKQKISSVDLNKLEEKVKSKGLEWRRII